MSCKKALEQYIEATNTHEFSNVKNMIDDNAVYWFTNKTCVTLNEIREYFESSWDLVKDEVYSLTDINWIAVDENSATCIYTYHWQGFINGKFVSGKGRGTNVFVKKSDDVWKIAHEHLSST